MSSRNKVKSDLPDRAGPVGLETRMNSSLNLPLELNNWTVLWRRCAEVVTEGTRLVLCSGGPLPGHADVPGSNPGRTLCSKYTLSD